jgi:hypothetical protein
MVKGEVVGVGSHDAGSPQVVGIDVTDRYVVGPVDVDSAACVLAIDGEVLECDVLGLGDVYQVVRELPLDDGLAVDATGEGDVATGGGAGGGVEGGGALVGTGEEADGVTGLSARVSGIEGAGGGGGAGGAGAGGGGIQGATHLGRVGSRV